MNDRNQIFMPEPEHLRRGHMTAELRGDDFLPHALQRGVKNQQHRGEKTREGEDSVCCRSLQRK